MRGIERQRRFKPGDGVRRSGRESTPGPTRAPGSSALLELAGDKPSCYVPCSQLDLTAASPPEAMNVLSGREWFLGSSSELAAVALVTVLVAGGPGVAAN